MKVLLQVRVLAHLRDFLRLEDGDVVILLVEPGVEPARGGRADELDEALNARLVRAVVEGVGVPFEPLIVLPTEQAHRAGRDEALDRVRPVLRIFLGLMFRRGNGGHIREQRREVRHRAARAVNADGALVQSLHAHALTIAPAFLQSSHALYVVEEPRPGVIE